MSVKKEWWRGGVIYQIYPRSFLDSDGSGIGDLNGITTKLPYIASLGVDCIWISPFFTSPMKDFGYDVADFYNVDPIFGSIDDFDILIAKAHELNIKVIIDLVVSHTSDRHPWFVESKSSKDNPRADWYVWADPKPDGSPPNNWQSVFGGSAWQFNTHREQYYLHNFLKEQPDLNYHCPAVQDAILDIARYWLDKGVDGFRLDVVNFYFHDKSLRDNPPKSHTENDCIQYEGLYPYKMQRHIHDKSQPENIEFLERFRALTDQYGDRFMVGEIGDDTPFDLAAEYTKGDKRIHTAYSTQLMSGQNKLITAKDISGPLIEEKSINGESWPCWAFSNHDVTRVASRWNVNNPNNNPDFLKMVMAMLLSLRGTACLYQGEELGLTEAQIAFDHIQDPWGKEMWPEWQGRDGCRTPMPWESHAPNAGFSVSALSTWLPIPVEHYPMAVSEQINDPQSLLSFTKEFIAWRKDKDPILFGDIDFIDHGDDVLVFKRTCEGTTYLCAFNLREDEQLVSGIAVKEEIYSFGSSLSGNGIKLGSFGFSVAVC